jgi:hypothetical protein
LKRSLAARETREYEHFKTSVDEHEHNNNAARQQTGIGTFLFMARAKANSTKINCLYLKGISISLPSGIII